MIELALIICDYFSITLIELALIICDYFSITSCYKTVQESVKKLCTLCINLSYNSQNEAVAVFNNLQPSLYH